MGSYLVFRYFTHRSFYERLANPMQSLGATRFSISV
ncbi:sensor histidine kinase [Bacillus thuringiensis serovar kurstaki str. YBT-1520]|nr:sensor histidine kinase [Bacillus thuringiensis serovar kurstaki str. YBT-1520]